MGADIGHLSFPQVLGSGAGYPNRCALQLKREAEGKQPNLADVRESGSIEQDADLILFLHRDREINKTQDQRSEQIETELIVAKQRNGPIGKTTVWFKPAFAKFVNMERYER